MTQGPLLFGTQTLNHTTRFGMLSLKALIIKQGCLCGLPTQLVGTMTSGNIPWARNSCIHLKNSK